MTRLHAVRSAGGDGPTVLLVHGFASDHRATWGTSGWLAALDRAGRRWVAVDLPGHGASDKPHDRAAYAVPAILDALEAAVGDPEPVDVVGYSLGGELALDLAVTRPARVRRLVAGGFGGQRALTAAEADAVLAHATGGGPLPEGRGGWLWRGAQAAAPDADRPALAACLAGVSASARPADLGTFGGPALLFAGAEDELAAGLAGVAAALPAGELVELPHRNHVTTLSSARLKRRAIDFLAQTSTAASAR